MKVLAGDLGGTKALLGVAEVVPGQRPVFAPVSRLASADFADCAALLAAYRDTADDRLSGVDAVCLAIAGPIDADGRHARFTNLPWQADAAALSALLGAPVRLANDFAAVAAGIAVVDRAAARLVQPGTTANGGVRLAIGAGTGLGVAALLGSGTDVRILGSEGGHIGFAPQDECELRIHAALLREYGRVTAERVVSGPGLAAIHRILTGETQQPAEIAARALAGEARAGGSVDVFFAAYGAIAGDLALTFLARGGVFLAGGVTQSLLPLLPASPFLQRFNAKAEHAALAASLPVWALGDAQVGLLGAACLAAGAVRSG